MKKITFVFLPFIVTPCVVSCNRSDDFTAMRDAYRKYLIETTNFDDYKDKTASDIMQEVNSKDIGGIETYYFPDLDYDYCYDRASDKWPALKHMNRTFHITLAYATRHDNALKDIAVKLTNYWVFNNYRNTNWFNNELGADSTLGNIGLFIYDDLCPKAQSMLRGRIAEASIYHHPSLATHTGANLFDFVNATLKSSIISRNWEELDFGITRAEDEITDENKEGFQKDGSFFQHGQQLQTASYGKSSLRLGRIMYVLSHSSRKFDQSKLNIISRYILRGLRSITHKGYLNYSSAGREYVRRNNMTTSGLSDLKFFVDYPGFPDNDQLIKYIDDNENKRSTFNGIVYFDNAKMVTMNIDDLYISFKGADYNLTNTECVTDENSLGLNLSYATNTCIMDRGDEYYNIPALWDYSYIPGTTSIQYYQGKPLGDNFMSDGDKNIYKINTECYKDSLYEQTLPTPEPYGSNLTYKSGYDEANNIAYFMQRSRHHEENEFTITSIACEDGMVLIGAELSYTGEKSAQYIEGTGLKVDPTLHTTLQQCMATGNEELSADGLTLTCGNAFYRSLDGKEINVVKDRMVNSKEYRNYRRYDDKDLGEDVSGKLFLAYLNLETNRDGKYAYSIQPTTRKSKVFEVKNNFDRDEVQEVRLPNGKVVIIPYKTVSQYQPSVGGPINLIKDMIVIL
ncbi:MAG: hypothetical protein MJ214_01950 [Bacilli bacterium]|nr:hypothetical protein [Bacilli bacterium]